MGKMNENCLKLCTIAATRARQWTYEDKEFALSLYKQNPCPCSVCPRVKANMETKSGSRARGESCSLKRKRESRNSASDGLYAVVRGPSVSAESFFSKTAANITTVYEERHFDVTLCV
ncbi:uncharacterized protein LOC126183733 [Schistocerca cancellata]|uniref:uncharacterized protein LOC126183733 n=1 Tax=Schistocerca cancellata TaxID=274614 RepID=UPI002118A584|nr:uncharacterized protein LOC126183733 [Schistocerca cancellata]